jgi:hypothetical protein
MWTQLTGRMFGKFGSQDMRICFSPFKMASSEGFACKGVFDPYVAEGVTTSRKTLPVNRLSA